MNHIRVLVYGAGSIGCYIGGVLLNAGVDCTFVGRESTRQNIEKWGLRLTDLQHRDIRLDRPVKIITDDRDLPEADLILLTVKCKDVADAAKRLADKIGDNALVICLQNGVGARDIACKYLPLDNVLSGVVSFNVLNMGRGRFHRGTRGELILELHPKLMPALSTQEGLPIRFTSKIDQVLWGKLLLNLNNSINALSGLPLVQELSQRGYRKVLAASMGELLSLLKQKGIKPESPNGISPVVSAFILMLPDWLFLPISRKMLEIDPLARSSMWQDLENRTETEIDYLNGAIVRLAEELGKQAPVNACLIQLIKKAESSAKGSPMVTARQLSQLMG